MHVVARGLTERARAAELESSKERTACVRDFVVKRMTRGSFLGRM